MKSILDESKFQPPGGRDAATVNSRVLALSQPTGRQLPQMIPDNLPEEAHLKIALASVHPFQRPMQVESNMQRAA